MKVEIMTDRSIVEYFGLGDGHSCGYCGNSDTNISHGLWAHHMTCRDYEDLMNRGWRRSGKYVYKPLMNVTCCPAYTIRCDATAIKLSKSQKKVLKKINKFLLNGEGNERASAINTKCEEENRTQVCRTREGAKKMNEKGNIECQAVCKPNEPSEKHPPKGYVKNLEDFINELDGNSLVKHTLEVKNCTIYSMGDGQDLNFKEQFSLFCKYQQAVHNDPVEKLTFARFKRFLVNSPLIAEGARPGLPSTGYGSFHQQYLLDGQLIAVGVIDILPHCVSSKYFFYDPAYSFLSLGTYSALREIYFVRRLQEECPSLKYYYMGYYIHSCHKMRYKGNYDPSFLLCPESYRFIPINACLDKLDKSKYSRLAAEEENSDAESTFDAASALILHGNQAMPFQLYADVFLTNENRKRRELLEVLEYCQLAGIASKNMLLFRK